jgi:hypothetical protein
LIDRDLHLSAFREFNVPHSLRIFRCEWLLAEHMSFGGGTTLNDRSLLRGIHRDVGYFDLSVSQEVIRGLKDTRNRMFFRRSFRFLTVTVGDPDDLEAGLLVGGKMAIVDDPTGSDDPNSVI